MDLLVGKEQLFMNPQKLPLNQLYLAIKDVKQITNPSALAKCDKEKFPAIHEIFIDKQAFPMYEAYYWNAETHETNKDIYMKNCEKYLEALGFLLQLNYHQFWCYVLKYSGTANMLNSFLYNFSPCVDLNLMDKECAQCVTKIQHKFGRILSRFFTYSHSEEEYMSPAVVLQYLENCGLLTFEGVLNICVLYKKMCPSLVDEITGLYFHLNRKSQWLSKVEAFAELTYMVLESTNNAICGDPNDAIIESLGLCTKQIDLCWHTDVASLIIQTLSTLQAFLEFCPSSHKELLKNIVAYVPKMYEPMFLALYKFLRSKTDSTERQTAVERVFQLIITARKLCIEVFHVLVDHHLNSIATSESEEVQASSLEQYLNMINGLLEEELFLFDYNTSKEIETQFDIISAYYSDLDPTQTDYIRTSLNSLPNLNEITKRKAVKKDRSTKSESERQKNESIASSSNNAPQELTAEERLQLVASIFPDFPPECIEACLEFCNNDCDMVTRLIIENNLPPHIVEMQRTGVLIPPEPTPAPPVRAYRGKQPKAAANANQLLDDKSDLQLKEIILKAVDLRQDIYDDEFDDREEYQQIRAPFARDSSSEEEESEEEERRPGSQAVPGRPGPAGTGDVHATRGGFRAFCEDPAKLREQREMAKSNFRGRGGHHHGGSRDVVGRPKGQGQDEQVTRNRNKKNVNKASKGNHNRKRGAAWKASRGMF